MDREHLPITGAYVLDQWRVLYVTTPKAGCTSILHALASAQGEQLQPRRSRAAEVTRSLTVHDRDQWKHTRDLYLLPDASLAAIDAGRGWLIMCVVRDPLTRVWAAWFSKLLLREPQFLDRFRDQPWFPRYPDSFEGLVEDFGRFISALREDPALLDTDHHWAPQSRILASSTVPYTYVGRSDAMDAAFDVLTNHLVEQGWAGQLPRRFENRSMIGLPYASVPSAVLAQVDEIYADDFAAFDYPPASGRPMDTSAPAEVTRVRLEACRQLIERHERIADLLLLLPSQP